MQTICSREAVQRLAARKPNAKSFALLRQYLLHMRRTIMLLCSTTNHSSNFPLIRNSHDLYLDHNKAEGLNRSLFPSCSSMSDIRFQRAARHNFPGAGDVRLCTAVRLLMLSLASLTSPGADGRDIGFQSFFLSRVRLGRQLDQGV